MGIRSWFRFLPLAFFGALLFSHASQPTSLVFDEVHYIPSAKALGQLADNLNWVHPPLAKWIMGAFWAVFTNGLGWIGEPTVFRCVSILFGLWPLLGIHAWMRRLGYKERQAQVAVWLTGFNFLWFVQSRTAMLDIFYAAFGIWALLYIAGDGRATEGSRPSRSRTFFLGWVLLGFSAASKWAAAPFFVVAVLLTARPYSQRALGVLVAILTYYLCFVPMALLEANPVALLDIPYRTQRVMLDGMNSIAAANHPYVSHWWEWPTLMRPMWYAFEHPSGALPGGDGEQCVWGGGNPVLFWTALPFLLFVAWDALMAKRPRSAKSVANRDPGPTAARSLALLFWVPLLFWGVAPRKLQMFYYYLPSSLWVGPIVVWAHERLYYRIPELRRGTRGWLLLGFTLLCAATFLYFLPIMDGRVLPPGRYYQYMWFRSWI